MFKKIPKYRYLESVIVTGSFYRKTQGFVTNYRSGWFGGGSYQVTFPHTGGSISSWLPESDIVPISLPADQQAGSN
jgi:hypothetical protein